MTETAQLSDGYHTFDELYRHRHVLFALVAQRYAPWGFRTWRTADGRVSEGWFIVGLMTPYGQVSYHMPASWWSRLNFLRVVERNVGYDGHTSEDVVQRLGLLLGTCQDADNDQSEHGGGQMA